MMQNDIISKFLAKACNVWKLRNYNLIIAAELG